MVSYFIVFLLIRRTLADWPVDYEPETIFKSLAASLAMGVILYWMSILLGSRSFKLIFILSQVAVGIAVYCLALLALKTFSREELLYLKRAFSLGES
ncbi:MAG: hypothetical protein D4R73_08985 [Deltaproteobacteria bacterium]|nr:MAG: hypothetical protein D4R73_08985 [Deltaproteobacteria bacterium]